MFNKILSIFHDGMVIIEDGNIVYQNEQVKSIFNLR